MLLQKRYYKTMEKLSLSKLGETELQDQTSALFSILSDIDALQKREYEKELDRIRNKKPSDYPKTIYVYSKDEIPEGYVELTQKMSSIFMLRKYARKVFRNTKGKKMYIIPSLTTMLGKEYPSYTLYSPVPEAGVAIIPITRRI